MNPLDLTLLSLKETMQSPLLHAAHHNIRTDQSSDIKSDGSVHLSSGTDTSHFCVSIVIPKYRSICELSRLLFAKMAEFGSQARNL